MARFDGFVQGLQAGTGVANTALDYLSAKDRIALGEKQLAQSADLASQGRAFDAAKFAWEQQKFQQEQGRIKQAAIESRLNQQNTDDRAIAGLTPEQIQQLNLIRQARAAQQMNASNAQDYNNSPELQSSTTPPMPQASNAKVTIGKDGMKYSGTMQDVMLDSQHPQFGPVIGQSLNNTLSAQTGGSGGIPISPMAMNRYQQEQDARATEQQLKLNADARADREATRSDRSASLDPLKLRLQAAGLNSEGIANYNAMGGDGLGVLPDKIPIANVAPSLNDQQSQALGFAKRMALSENELADVLKDYDPTTIRAWFQGKGMYPELAKSQDYKRFEQAAKNWAAAALRKESGAAISESEYKGAMSQYFPQVNDSQDVISQKVNSRNAYFDSMLADLPPYYREQVLKSRMNGGQSASRNAPQEGSVIHQDGMNYMFKGGSYVPVQ
jgi:hypothetical protein